MKTFELLHELDVEIELHQLEEAKRKRSKLITTGSKESSGARNYVAKNMNLAGKGGVQKAKKGKGSYTRKKVNKNNY
jgi:hypothetical protein